MIKKLKTAITQSSVIQQLQTQYEDIPHRNRILLFSLSGVTIAVMFFMLIYLPLMQWSDKKMDYYDQQVSIFSWLTKNIQTAKDQENRAKNETALRDMPAVVSQTAKQTGISISRIQPTKKGVDIWVDDAAYQKILSWLVVLENQHYIIVQRIKLEQLKEEGRVKTSISFAS